MRNWEDDGYAAMPSAFFAEANGMLVRGGINETLDGHVVVEQDLSSVTDRHREIVKDWIDGRPEFCNGKVGQLSDAWHSEFD